MSENGIPLTSHHIVDEELCETPPTYDEVPPTYDEAPPTYDEAMSGQFGTPVITPMGNNSTSEMNLPTPLAPPHPDYGDTLIPEGPPTFSSISPSTSARVNHDNYIDINISPVHGGTDSGLIELPTTRVAAATTTTRVTAAASYYDGDETSCVLFLVLFVIMTAIPIAMIVLGIQNWNDCPMESKIPFYMVTCGFVYILTTILFILYGVGGTYFEQKQPILGNFILMNILLGILVFTAIEIWGSIIVFRNWNNWYQLKDNEFIGCHNPTYLFSFSLLIIFWIVFPCICCCGLLT